VLALGIRHGLAASDLRRELFFHPSVSEAIYSAGKAEKAEREKQ